MTFDQVIEKTFRENREREEQAKKLLSGDEADKLNSDLADSYKDTDPNLAEAIKKNPWSELFKDLKDKKGKEVIEDLKEGVKTLVDRLEKCVEEVKKVETVQEVTEIVGKAISLGGGLGIVLGLSVAPAAIAAFTGGNVISGLLLGGMRTTVYLVTNYLARENYLPRDISVIASLYLGMFSAVSARSVIQAIKSPQLAKNLQEILKIVNEVAKVENFKTPEEALKILNLDKLPKTISKLLDLQK